VRIEVCFMSIANPEKKARRPNLIRSIRERALQAGIHADTLRSEIANGVGPAVIKLSPKRYGISDKDWEAWLKSRRIATPDEVDDADDDDEEDGADNAEAKAQDAPPAPPPAARLQTKNLAAAPRPQRQTLEEKIRLASTRSLAEEEEAAILRQASPAPSPQPRRTRRPPT
jgi:hypothetical protein